MPPSRRAALALMLLIGCDRPAPPPPVPTPTPVEARPPSLTDELVAFLQRVQPEFDAAKSRCGAALECRFIWDPGSVWARGRITDVVAVPGCLARSIPLCEEALGALVKVTPPPSFADHWRNYVRNSVVSQLLNARVTRDMLASLPKLPRVKKGPLSDYADLQRWAEEHNADHHAQYKALIDENDLERANAVVFEDWIETLDLCEPRCKCGVEKVMHERCLKPRYMAR
jgi:hypothetical protein